MLGGGDLIYRGTKIRITECFLLETMKTRKEERENGIKFKVLKGEIINQEFYNQLNSSSR